MSGPLVAKRQEVHGRGQFYPLEPEDYLRNPTAIKSLLNEKNQLQRQVDEAVDPSGMRIAIAISAVLNIFAVSLVGIGTNLITGEHPPIWSTAVFWLGIGLSVLATAAPAVVAFVPGLFRRS